MIDVEKIGQTISDCGKILEKAKQIIALYEEKDKKK